MAKVKQKTKPVKKPAYTVKTVSASKKKNAQGRSASKSKEWESLAKELKSLIPKLDEEGLAFLVKQSHVHLYNMQVDALNKNIIKDNERKKGSVVKKTIRTNEQGFSDIKISESGSSYYIIYDNEWITFSKNEMTIIVKIALAEGEDIEIRERLFNWLSMERSDLLNAASIGNKFDEKLISLVSLIKNNFKLKQK
ncbi:MAG: hypothetical protein LBQ93_02125 [Treponema sp.]|jgi:hypothetical protein|nr:hypothetical protein [Treponema sp.]